MRTPFRRRALGQCQGCRSFGSRSAASWPERPCEALKTEVRHIWGPIDQLSRSQLRTILFDYIEVFYNRARHQRRLGDRTPAETYAAASAA